MSILYHPGKDIVIADALRRSYMGRATHFEKDKNEIELNICTDLRD